MIIYKVSMNFSHNRLTASFTQKKDLKGGNKKKKKREKKREKRKRQKSFRMKIWREMGEENRKECFWLWGEWLGCININILYVFSIQFIFSVFGVGQAKKKDDKKTKNKKKKNMKKSG